MKINISLIICFLSYIKSELINKEIGAECKTTNDGAWTCKILSQCPQVGDFRKSRPDICGFHEKEPIICCPPDENLKTESAFDQQFPNAHNKFETSTTQEEEFDLSILSGNDTVDIFQPSANSPPHSVTKCIENEIKLCLKNTFRNNSTQDSNNMDLEEPLFVVAIGKGLNKNIKMECAGSVVHERWILSSAHCAQSNYGIKKWVAIGYKKIIDGLDNTFQLAIAKIVVHPLYDMKFMYHDIALFQTEHSIMFNIYLNPSCLHPLKVIPRNSTSIGWKRNEGGEKSWSLRKVNMKANDPTVCKKMYNGSSLLPRGFDDEIMICASETENNTCVEDRGGPLYIKSTICLHAQLGIVPFGRECSNRPGVFTRVSYYLPWIESVIWPEVVQGNVSNIPLSELPQPRDVYYI